MYKCLFDRASGICLTSIRGGEIPFDSATQVIVLVPNDPDRRTERWDGGTGVRAATAQELADYDDGSRRQGRY